MCPRKALIRRASLAVTASGRIHPPGEAEKAQPSAGDPSWRAEGFAQVLQNPGNEAAPHSAVLAGNGEHLAAFSSCLCAGWAAETKHPCGGTGVPRKGQIWGLLLPASHPAGREAADRDTEARGTGERRKLSRQKGQRGFSCLFDRAGAWLFL